LCAFLGDCSSIKHVWLFLLITVLTGKTTKIIPNKTFYEHTQFLANA